MMKKFVIEREINDVGSFEATKLGEASKTSNEALAKLDGIQWQYSFVTADKTFCVYLAESEDVIRQHAELSGFPANKITEVVSVIDPTTEQQCPVSQPA